MNGNAIATPVENLNWEIRKARIVITLNDIITEQSLTLDEIGLLYSCKIENEYLPANVVDLQDKIEYLNLKYTLLSSPNNYIKIISATTNSFDIYDIQIINAEYREVVYSLNYNIFTTSSLKGFAKDCTFNASTEYVNSSIQALCKKQNLQIVKYYSFSFSYLNNNSATISMPINRTCLLNSPSVYLVKNNTLTKLNTTYNNNLLNFVTSDQEATYIIAYENHDAINNYELLTLVIIIGLYIGLCIGAIISNFKHKHY